MKILLGKKLRPVIFGLLLAVAIGFLASRTSRFDYGTVGILSANNLDGKMHTKALNNVTKKDSDGDGLKDWEEELWGTDPRKKDTDGDGTDDGDEIDIGRNPKVAGPNDAFDNGFIVSKKESDNKGLGKDLTATDLFAQNLFGEYLSLRGSGQYIRDEDKDLLVASVIENALNTRVNEQYEISDLNIIDSNNAEVLKKYGNDFASILQLYLNDSEDEVFVFERMLRTENKEDVEYLNQLAETYNIVSGKLSEIKTPSQFTFTHIDIVNSYEALSGALKDMSVALSDPIRAMNGFAVYTATIQRQEELFKEIQDGFIENIIIFGVNEPGYVWHTI